MKSDKVHINKTTVIPSIYTNQVQYVQLKHDEPHSICVPLGAIQAGFHPNVHTWPSELCIHRPIRWEA
ncbi:hypothetical protein BpHYR1_016244 [Brachionus plicatilis]|uniref:Uncharacterized protein n=1 Tax=Brachionus plicatilis TaxID=10195 RepID=A0A3M7RJ54_BRAPC|nr:hypothetical protein BpHYR1_016244 [Brachionus plicatilis]